MRIGGDVAVIGNNAQGNAVLQNFGTVNFETATMGADFFINENGGSVHATELSIEGSYLNYGETEGSTLTVAEGEIYQNGPGAGALTQFETVVLENGTIINGGQFIAGVLTGQGDFENQSYLVADDVAGATGFAFANGENGVAVVQNNAAFNMLDNEGDLTVNGAMEVFGQQGPAYNGHNLTVGGALAIADKTFVNAGRVETGALTTESGGAVWNEGLISVRSSLDDVNYIEVGEAAEIAFEGSITNSHIALFDGAVWKNRDLGTGNVYTLESSVAQPITDQGVFDDTWRDGFSIIETSEVNGLNSFILNEGGLLAVQTIGDFTSDGMQGKVTLDGGAIETHLDQIFSDVAYQDSLTGTVISDPDVIGDFIAANTVGDVTANAAAGITIEENGGHLVFNDALYSFDTVLAVDEKLDETAGWQEVTTHFTGKNANLEQIVTDTHWANAVTSKLHGSVVLHDVTLIAADDDHDGEGMFSAKNGVLTMDGTKAPINPDGEGTMTTEFGVGAIVDADLVKVQNGAHLTLVGFGEDQALISNAAGEVGDVSVENAALTFGFGAGKVGDVSLANGGALEVLGGQYSAEKVDVENGLLTIQNGLFTVAGDANVNGTAVNKGSLVIDGSFKLTGGEFTNDSVVSGNALDVSGGKYVNNNAAGWSDVTISGAAENNGTESISGDYVLAEGGMQTNAGYQDVAGTASIDGTYANGSEEADGRLDVDGVITIGQTGTLTNYGLISGKDAMIVGGLVDNLGSIVVSSLTAYGTAASSQFLNREDGTLRVTNDAELLSLNNSGSVFVGGDAKIGTVANANDSLLQIEGSLTDAQSISNSGLILVGTGLVTAGLTNQNGGRVIVDGGSTVGTLSNRGIISVGGNLDLIDVADNYGALSVGGTLGVDDVLMNHEDGSIVVYGGLDAKAGTIVNRGGMGITTDEESEFGANFGSFVNEADAGLLVDEAAKTTVATMFDNQGTAVLSGGLESSGEIRNSGMLDVDGAAAINGKFQQTAGTFTSSGATTLNADAAISGGTALFADVNLTGGKVVVSGSGTNVAMNFGENAINGAIAVESGAFTAGDPMADALSNVSEPSAYGALFNAHQAITLGENGIIAVGSGAEEKLSELKGGDVWFGSDSLFALNTSQYDGAIIKGNGSGSLTAEVGAQILVTDATLGWGSYQLVGNDPMPDDVQVSQGFENVSIDGWLEHGNVIYNGDHDVDVVVKKDENGEVIVTVGSNNILDKLPNVAIPNLVNEVISDTNRSPNDPGVKGFLAGAIENGILAEHLQAETINDTAQIMAAGGVLVQGMTLVGNAMDITDRHLSYEDVHFKNGELQKWDGVRFWADALGQRVDASGYDYSGGEADFDGYNAGFIFGADLMAPCGARYGAAFAYQRADIDSNGSAVKTSNEADAYTFTLYAAKDFGKFNVIGSASYTRIDSDLEQSLPGSFGKHTMDVSNDIYTFGLKGEYNIALSKSVQAVPYVGVRAVWMDTSDEKSKLNGASAFDYDTDSVTQVQFPIGVAFQGTMDMSSGWTSRGVIDLSVTPVAGDKDVDTTIRANGLNGKDVVNTEFSDDVTGAIRIGVMAEKDAFAFGGNLGFSTGGDRSGNVTFGLNARYRF